MKMRTNSKIEFHTPIILALATLAAVAIPMLWLPYCYSEAQIMTDQVLYMKNQGLGWVMNNGNVELPNLFSVIYATLAKFVGTAPVLLHGISLIFSAISIIAAYKFGKFFFSVHAGVMSASIMMLQNVFMAQTGLALPIMMLNACLLSGMYLFFREKYLGCMICMISASLIDIQGVAASVVLLVAYLRIEFREWTTSKNILMGMPIAIWLLYESASVVLCGKFSMRFDGISLGNFWENIRFIFVDQYRLAITVLMVVLMLVNLSSKNTQYFIKDMANKCLTMMAVLYVINSMVGSQGSWNLPAISLTAIFTACTISTMPISYQKKYIMACALMMTSAINVLTNNNVDDASVKYKDKIKVDLKTISLLENAAEPNSIVFSDKDLKKFLTYWQLGYKSNDNYRCGNKEEGERADYVIISNFRTEDQTIDTDNMTKINTLFINDYKTEIWKRK